VFEAWEEGSRMLDQDALADLLVCLDDGALGKRVGYMIENCGHPLTSSRLGAFLERSRSGPVYGSGPQSLLPGIEYERVSDRWQLRVP
jgi:hypothetical protein